MASLRQTEVSIPVGQAVLAGTLTLPPEPHGVVLFAHGSGSSRFSPRNQFVAEKLHESNLGTLLMDLLTRQEEAIDDRTAHLRFDIGLLAGRLIAATDWLSEYPDTEDFQVGHFGASTGAAAALVAAAERREVGAVVSRGGRPDLAGAALSHVESPTLLIVGSNDEQVLEMNRLAYERLRCEKRLAIVAGASHLFEEPGTLEEVARLGRMWLEGHLGPKIEESAAA